MFLAIDILNKYSHIGVFNDGSLICNFSMTTDKSRSIDELKLLLKLMLTEYNISISDIDGVIISTVVPELKDRYEKVCGSLFNLIPTFISPGVKTGINIKCENPKDVGSDRIIRAVGAGLFASSDTIIISASSISTIDFINSKKEFMGGVILAGLDLLEKSLKQESARLPQVEIVKSNNILGKNTISSIQNGIYYGYKNAIWGVVSEIINENKLDIDKTDIILTGEYAEIISDGPFQLNLVDNLGLLGLAAIQRLNKKEN